MTAPRGYLVRPIGRVEILAVRGLRIKARNLEAVSGTPIIDLKPVLRP